MMVMRNLLESQFYICLARLLGRCRQLLSIELCEQDLECFPSLEKETVRCEL